MLQSLPSLLECPLKLLSAAAVPPLGGRKAKENGAGMENKKRWDEKGEGTSESRKETDWGSLPKESNENMKRLETLGRKGQRDRVR